MNLLITLGLLLYIVSSFSLSLYGIVLAFKKAWYLGLLVLVVPGVGIVIGACKLFFKKDLLND